MMFKEMMSHICPLAKHKLSQMVHMSSFGPLTFAWVLNEFWAKSILIHIPNCAMCTKGGLVKAKICLVFEMCCHGDSLLSVCYTTDRR